VSASSPGPFNDLLDAAQLRALLASATGAGVKVGLLDTGVDSNHPALGKRIAANYEVVGEGELLEVQRRWQGVDYETHGTACAGILLQAAPDVEVHSICVLGRMKKASLEQTIAGLEFAIDQDWDIINVSVGTQIFSERLFQLAERAFYKGQIVIAAKDNRPDVIGFPAAFSSVIGVDMDHHPGDFSFIYRAGCPTEVEAHGVYVDAPIPGGGQRAFTGTSFACPTVAGMAARFREVFPRLDPVQFRTILSVLSQKPKQA